METYNLSNNTLTLKVKKSPIFVRAILFFIAFSLFILPIGGAISSIVFGFGFQVGHFIGIGVFSLIGFYTLRVALWNTYGEENIQFFENKIIYEANYRWFKDGKKEALISNPNFYATQAGYEEDNEGVLIIASNEAKIESVVKMKMFQMEELIKVLKDKF
ncbi:hypothetical protein HNP37_002486 [Flavobacterium nitrogenifigens]|uniref:Uncharacterized protein n=2 Tax=Flavobacterium TaxID=237 RepID=A0A7W7N760_9FLAO|nr:MULTISPECIES: hypothetical protein [Flavobacterium]MBB4802413.1 hypothetical protein [Flavobacterium nitrogenifigens]MBB6387371.1 hypothetical protein [Flavobacterium notoginsengisoli]